jgi:hypothetical protein
MLLKPVRPDWHRVKLMREVIEKAIGQVIGCDAKAKISDRDDSAGQDTQTRTPLVVWGTSRNIARNLARQGYTNIRHFVVLPSCRWPRWVLPSGHVQRTLDAFQMYQPYPVMGRLLKWLLFGAIKIGWTQWAHSRLLVASKKPLPLELLVAELTGEAQPVFAFTLSTAISRRKLIVKVSRRDGTSLAYIKFPLTEAAESFVRHEAQMLRSLWHFPVLRTHIPKLLYAGEWEGSYILIQTSGPEGRGPYTFGRPHEHLLRTLWSVHRTSKPGHILVEEVAARWQEFEQVLDQEWRELGKRALDFAHLSLDGKQIPCGIMHGDFNPPNTRAENERLFILDWEYASWKAPVLWDMFNFQAWTRKKLHKFRENEIFFSDRGAVRASFALYLLDSSCRLLEENSPGTRAALQYRRRILLNELTELSAT